MKKDFITITNEDIYKELQHLKEVGQATLDQAMKTNGRVTKLEKVSIGNWIANHPFKFTLGVIIFISLLTPEAREIVFTYAKSKL
jgi:hypothetical protein